MQFNKVLQRSKQLWYYQLIYLTINFIEQLICTKIILKWTEQFMVKCSKPFICIVSSSSSSSLSSWSHTKSPVWCYSIEKKYKTRPPYHIWHVRNLDAVIFLKWVDENKNISRHIVRLFTSKQRHTPINAIFELKTSFHFWHIR